MLLSNIKKSAKAISKALWMECIETKEMLVTFTRFICGKYVSKGDIVNAKAQLIDIFKLLPVTIVLILPIPGLTEAYFASLILIERKFGIRTGLLPSQIEKLTQQAII